MSPNSTTEPMNIIPAGLPPEAAAWTVDELARWAGARALDLRREGFHCSEAVLRAAALGVGVELPEALLRTSTGFRGGGGGYGDRCGALNSGAMLISFLYGRVKATEDNACASVLTRLLHARFEREFGSTRCAPVRVYFAANTPDRNCAPVYEASTRLVVKLLAEAPTLCPACRPLPSLAWLRRSG